MSQTTDDSVASDASARDGAYWLGLIEQTQRGTEYQKWDGRCVKIRKRYLYEASQDASKRKYQILWSNMQTIAPAVYSKAPRPQVMRRWKDKDAIARAAGQMLERSISLQLELNGWHDQFKAVRDDFLLYARGAVRLRYEPVFDTVGDDEGEPDTEAVEGDQAAAQEETSEAKQPDEVLQFEHVKIVFLQRDDFAHSPARRWEEVEWVAFRAFMSRDEAVGRFGNDVGASIPLEAIAQRSDRDSSSENPDTDKAIIWEIWHKPSRRVIWVAKGAQSVLEDSEPYLRVEGFFPCPKPAFGTTANDSLYPVPDYVFYQDQAEEIDQLTGRIGALTDALKVVGFYPAGAADTTTAMEMAAKPSTDCKMIPIPNWSQFKDGGGAKGSLEWWPVDQVATVLEGCVKLRQQLIDDVNQIFGLSDIMRGDGNAGETATAQSIKAQYGSVRIRERQDELARFCADVARMAGEIIATHFQPETLMQMANMPLPTRQQIEEAQQQAALQARAQAQQQAQQQAMMQQQAAMQAQQQQPAPQSIPQGMPA